METGLAAYDSRTGRAVALSDHERDRLAWIGNHPGQGSLPGNGQENSADSFFVWDKRFHMDFGNISPPSRYWFCASRVSSSQ